MQQPLVRLLGCLEGESAWLVTLLEPAEVVQLIQASPNCLEVLARNRVGQEKRLKDTYDVYVDRVHIVTEKKRMRSKIHEVCSPMSVLRCAGCQSMFLMY